MSRAFVPGRVVKIRLSPQDCMAVVDVTSLTGVMVPGISFAQLVSSCLSSVLAGLREQRIIPTREGFEYAVMLEPFKDQPHIDRAQKLRITKDIKLQAVYRQHAPVAAPVVDRQKNARFTELAVKMEMHEVDMTEEEKNELRELTLELNPI